MAGVTPSLVRERGTGFFTIGYQSHNPSSFLRLLSANGVGLVVDVRRNPTSRKRGFSKESLQRLVARVGIEYLHLPDLGTPPAIRKFYQRTGDVAVALRRYEKYLRLQRDSLRELTGLVRCKVLCLLCLESDYTSCHRSVIARELSEMTGWLPVHLGQGGRKSGS